MKRRRVYLYCGEPNQKWTPVDNFIFWVIFGLVAIHVIFLVLSIVERWILILSR